MSTSPRRLSLDPVTAVADALGRVWALDPVILRRDTPLLDIGCDDVAVLAVFQLLLADMDITAPTSELELVLASATVGDLADSWVGATRGTGG